MRIPHWLTPLAIGFLLILGGRSVSAQMPYPAGYGQGYTPVSHHGMPPSAMAYPRISPFEHAFQNTYNKGGTWFSDSRPMFAPASRRFNLNVDLVSFTTRELDGIVGARRQYSEVLGIRGGGITRYLDLTAVAPADEATGTGDPTDFLNYHDPVNASSIGTMESRGIRISGGFESDNAPGFFFETMYNPEDTEILDLRKPLEKARYDVWAVADQPELVRDPRANRRALEQMLTSPTLLATDVTPFDYTTDRTHANATTNTNTFLQRNLYNLGGLPVDNGALGGTTIAYDMDFILKHKHEMFGGNMGFSLTPIVKSDGFTLRPLVSGRYMYIAEGFLFRGVDSGMHYGPGAEPQLFKEHALPNGIDDDGDLIIDNAGASEAGGGGGGAGLTAGFSLLTQTGMFESFLRSDVTTHLGGPEFALRYDVGGDRGRVYGTTRVGLMFNREKISISGNNIGNIHSFDATTWSPTTGATDLVDLFPVAGDQNRFTDEREATHISPLFEQTFQAEVPVFANIPLLRRVRALEGANLRLGYSWLWIGEVATPNDSVRWFGNPQQGLFPDVRIKRDSYHVSSWNFGINWTF